MLLLVIIAAFVLGDALLTGELLGTARAAIRLVRRHRARRRIST